MNYKMIVYPIMTDDGEEWIASFPDLEGCGGGGKTPQEAVAMAEEEKEIFILALEEMKLPIPKPRQTAYSGRISLRLGKTLHEKVAIQAEKDNVSINTYLQDAISLYVGNKEYEGKLIEQVERIEKASILSAECSYKNNVILSNITDKWANGEIHLRRNNG